MRAASLEGVAGGGLATAGSGAVADDNALGATAVAGAGTVTVLAAFGAPAGAEGTTDTPDTVMTADASESNNAFGNSAATNSPEM